MDASTTFAVAGFGTFITSMMDIRKKTSGIKKPSHLLFLVDKYICMMDKHTNTVNINKAISITIYLFITITSSFCIIFLINNCQNQRYRCKYLSMTSYF